MQIFLAMASSAISRFWPRLLGSLEGAKQHASLKVFDPLDLLFRVHSVRLAVAGGWCWFVVRKKYAGWPCLVAGADLVWEKNIIGWLQPNRVRCSKAFAHCNFAAPNPFLVTNVMVAARGVRNDVLKKDIPNLASQSLYKSTTIFDFLNLSIY